MQESYKLAVGSMRRRWARDQPEALETLDRLKKSQVAVYSGSYDHVEEVLVGLGIKFVVNPGIKRLKARIAFVNCSSQQTYSRDLREHAAAYVEKGGWLVTSDANWSVGTVDVATRESRATERGVPSLDAVESAEPAVEPEVLPIAAAVVSKSNTGTARTHQHAGRESLLLVRIEVAETGDPLAEIRAHIQPIFSKGWGQNLGFQNENSQYLKSLGQIVGSQSGVDRGSV